MIDMKNYIRILTMITALMFGAANGVWAQAILNDNDIEIVVNPDDAGCTVTKSISEREVTLTVTPATGYYIKASDIVAEKLVDPGKANAPKRRTSEICIKQIPRQKSVAWKEAAQRNMSLRFQTIMTVLMSRQRLRH